MYTRQLLWRQCATSTERSGCGRRCRRRRMRSSVWCAVWVRACISRSRRARRRSGCTIYCTRTERVVVCNVRGRSETSNKSDRIDADELSEMLRVGSIKSVYHGANGVLTLKELVRCYTNLVDDSTRVMLRIKALFRARAIPTPGTSVYRVRERAKWLARIENRGARMRAESLLRQLDSLLELRPKAKAAMIAEARRQPGWKVLRSIPFFGPVRVALLLAIMATPFRFRTKRQLWPYIGLAVVTRSSADQEFVNGKLRRRRRAPL